MDKELLEIVFDNLYNGIYLVDGQGVTIAVNRTFEEMSGFTNAELAGKSLYDLVGPDNYFTGSASLLVLERKSPVTATYSTKTGRKLLVKGRPIFDARGKIRLIVNTIWDLTVVQYSQKIDADTARSQFLSEEDIITCSERMNEVIDLALQVAITDSTILLSGESGVGKSLLAKLIHRSSERKGKPLIQVNCAAIPESLIESELFGYEAGAFTGADRRGKPGFFELADGGTVFLDEISELPIHIQSKLLWVLQDRSFFKVGGREATTVDVRIIAASNKDLAKLVATGGFREDLYYRLNVVPIPLPPLRERREDIPVLIRYFLGKFNRKHNCYKEFSPALVRQLTGGQWPGNIRELENAVERLVVTSRSDRIEPTRAFGLATDPILHPGQTLKEMVAGYEAEILLKAQQEFGTTRNIAAALGISQATASRKLQQALDDKDRSRKSEK
jgi:PAS domain S-box-containing protein